MDEKQPFHEPTPDVFDTEAGYLVQDDQKEDKDFDTGFEPDDREIRPIVGGIRIRGQQSIDFERKPSFGTLGCFAIPNEDTSRRVLLTNHHVLADPFDKLNGPSCTGCTKGDAVGNPNVGGQIATVLRGFDDARMDAAIAILDKGVEFQRDIIRDDIQPSEREVIAGKRDLTVADENVLIVHKRGHRTKVTFGRVGSISEGVTIGNLPRKENQIRIDLPEKVSGATVTFPASNRMVAPGVNFVAARVQPNDVAWIEGNTNRGRFRITAVGPPLAPDEIVVAGELTVAPGPFGGSLFVTGPNFALRGDSGSVLLDPQGRVVGLVWAARALRRGNAWATPIGVIEAELKIRIDTAAVVGDTQTARSSGSDPPAPVIPNADRLRPAVAAFGGEAAPTLRARVEQDLLPLPGGRQIYDLYFRHHMEVRGLIDGNKRVAVVWHRQGGPAMIQSVLDAVRSRTAAIPTLIHGKSWAERVAAVLAIFEQYGSARLRDDIASFGRDIKGLGGMTYPQFLANLRS
jgi:hypothetical protein